MYHALKIGQTWTIWDGFAIEPDAPEFRSRSAATAEADRVNAEANAWDRAGLADAPHCDAIE